MYLVLEKYFYSSQIVSGQIIKEHTGETKALLRAKALSQTKSNKPGHVFIVYDTLLNTTTEFPSIRKGVEAVG